MGESLSSSYALEDCAHMTVSITGIAHTINSSARPNFDNLWKLLRTYHVTFCSCWHKQCFLFEMLTQDTLGTFSYYVISASPRTRQEGWQILRKAQGESLFRGTLLPKA